MIVCYAPGAGLGHLTRVRAYLHTVHKGQPATIVTASPFGTDARVVGGHRIVRPPATGTTPDWLRDTLRDLAPAELVVDAFPGGIAGEVTAAVPPPGTRTVHLARLLRLDAYRTVLPADPPRYDETWTVEPLTAPHRAYLAAISARVEPLALADPEPGTGPDPDLTGAWLVVHTGPAAELAELLDYARETAEVERLRPRLVLVTPQPPPELPGDVHHLDRYPAWPLFAGAARIISAAGCNIVRQAAPWRERHRMLPFPRRFDDQFARAARTRTR